MIRFDAIIKKFDKQGEKTGWTYIDIKPEIITKIKGDYRKSFRVKGTLDKLSIHNMALIPMGEGNFILPLNATIRKGIQKTKGATLKVSLEEDTKPFTINKNFKVCLDEDTVAKNYFMALTYGHKNYFNTWINAAKSPETIAKRIALVLDALNKKMNFGEMIRSRKII